MPRRIRVPDRVIIHIRIPIPRLRALRLCRNNGVGRSESANRRVKPARAVKIKPKLGLFPLTCKFVVRAEIAGGETRLAEGFVERGGGLDSAGVGGDRRTAEMVSEQEGQRPIRAAPRGESRRARKIIFGDRRPLFLVMLTHVIRGRAAYCGLDLFSIRIPSTSLRVNSDKTCRHRANQRDQPILGVILQCKPNIQSVVNGCLFLIIILFFALILPFFTYKIKKLLPFAQAPKMFLSSMRKAKIYNNEIYTGYYCSSAYTCYSR